MNNCNKITITIPGNSNISHMVLQYATLYTTQDDMACQSIYCEDGVWKPEFTLPIGISTLDFNGEEIIFEYIEEGMPVGLYFSADKYRTIIISIKYNADDENDKKQKKEVLDNFFKVCRKYYDRKNDNEVVCKILRDGTWVTLSKLPKRKLDTVYLPKGKKDCIIKDLERFYDSENEYISLGIPWKRNYLLEGSPGTGKSSLVFALASHFNLSINIINLGPQVDDSVFMSAISSLSNKTILLLEDIDSLFVERKVNDSNKSMVSFSGILNVLDGMARKNGLITILTTNYKDRLDSALIRPGRVDFCMKFGKTTKEQLIQMTNKITPDFTDTDKLWKKVRSNDLRTCVLQQYLLECRFQKKDPIEYIDRFNDIMREIVSDKPPDGIYH